MRTGRSVWRRAGIVAVALAAVATATACSAYLWASERYSVSADPTATPPVRLAAAQAAASAWPFSVAFRARAAMLGGMALYEEGDILGAYDVLHTEYVREVVGDDVVPELAAAHAIVYRKYLEASSRTAHVMHGKEQADATVLPEDVQHFPKPAPK